MGFNLSFDYAALTILFFLILSIVFRKQYHGISNKLFISCILITMIATALDILASQDSFSVAFLFVLNTFFIFFWPSILVMLFFYCTSLTQFFYVFVKKKLMIALVLIPIIILFVLLIINIPTGIIFVYTDGSNGPLYARGDFMWVAYAVSTIYGVSAFLCLLVSKKFHTLSQIIPIIIAFTLQVGSFVFQFLIPKILVEMIMCSLTLLTLSIFVESAEYNVDYKTQQPSLNAFVNHLGYRFNFNEEFAVIFLHVDNSAALYNLYPHNKSYALLRHMSNEMLMEFRKMDRSSTLFFIGESTFAFVYNNKACDKGMLKFLEEYFSDFVSTPDGALSFRFLVTTCVVECFEDCHDAESLISFSTSFLRFSGDSRFIDLKPYRREKGNLLMDLDQILERGIKEKSFSIYYQPIYSIKDKKFRSAESLVRLVDPTYGMIMPSLMIPYSEQWGKIVRMGDIILEKSFDFFAKSLRDKLDYLEINLSPIQLLDSMLIKRVRELSERYYITPDKIIFEITETVAVQNNPTIIESINTLSDLGYRIAVDDFGTGYSNLARLAHLNISIVKFDMSMAKVLMEGEYDGFFLSMIDMFHEHGIEVLIEGVEEKALVDKVIAMGCEYIQGFYYSKPIPEEELLSFLDNAKNS